MATYSQELESVLKSMNDSTETVLPLCNNLRADFKTILHKDVHFRNYRYDAIKLFEYLSELERAALWVISGIEVIRRQNADLMTTTDQASSDSSGDTSSNDSAGDTSSSDSSGDLPSNDSAGDTSSNDSAGNTSDEDSEG